MPAPDDGRRVKPSSLVLGAFLGGVGLTALAWLAAGPKFAAAAALVFFFPAVILAGLVATVAWSAWLHRFTVFTNMKANVDPNER